MNAQLDHEVHLQLGRRISRPVGVLLVDLPTSPTPSHNRGKPILIAEQDIGQDSGEGVENRVQTQFGD
jgi:hypothetical protein